jgi:hypothetical protein
MCDVVVVTINSERPFGDDLARHLAGVGLAAEAATFGTSAADVATRTPTTWVFQSSSSLGQPEGAAMMLAIGEAARTTSKVVVIADPRQTMPPWSPPVDEVVHDGESLDRIIASVLGITVERGEFRAITGGGLLSAPTGVSWWQPDFIVVACDANERLVGIDPVNDRYTTLFVGLNSPHGVFQDREKILVGEKNADRLLAFELQDRRLLERPTVARVGNNRLLHPHHAVQRFGTFAIADTDHHRAVVGDGDLVHASHHRNIETLDGFGYPCGVEVTEHGVLVLDTDHDRLVFVERNGGARHVLLEIDCPLQIAIEGSTFAIAGGVGLTVGTMSRTSKVPSISVSGVYPRGHLAALREPWGVSINRSRQLVIADRGRGLLWTAPLDTLLAGARAA